MHRRWGHLTDQELQSRCDAALKRAHERGGTPYSWARWSNEWMSLKEEIEHRSFMNF